MTDDETFLLLSLSAVNTVATTVPEHVYLFSTCWLHSSRLAVRCVRCDVTCTTVTLHRLDGDVHLLSADGALSHLRAGHVACR